MCYLPIHATIVAFLFKVTGKVPKTETEIYDLFTRFTLIRSISKNKDIGTVDVAKNVIHCLSNEEQYYFQQICQLALTKTLSNKQVLHQDEISSYFQVDAKERDISLGLITIDCTADLYGFKNIYTFLHLTFQEYLAAYHISTLSDEEQIKLIEEHGHKNHMLVVWKFFCGLIQIKPLERKFKIILNKTDKNTLFHLQCAYESQQKIACAQLLKAVHYHIRLENQFLSTPDFTAIGYVTNTTVLPMKLSLKDCDVNVVAIDALLTEMDDKSRQSLETLHIETNTLNTEVMTKLLANLLALKSLSLVKGSVSSSFGDEFTKSTFSAITAPTISQSTDFSALKKIQTLTLKGFQEESEDFQIMIFALRQCERLIELNVISNRIGKPGAKYLAQSLPYCRKLEKINISKNGIPRDGIVELIGSMKQLNMRIKPSEITDQVSLPDAAHSKLLISNSELIACLKPFTNLQSLDLLLDIELVDVFKQASKGWKRLKELRIASKPRYVLDIIKAVSKSLQLYFHNIETLVLKHAVNNLEAAESLSAGLMKCHNLQVLNLSDNLITLIQLRQLLLLNLSNLKELYLDNNRVRDNEINALSSCLKHCHNLQILGLSKNSISSNGAMVLAAELHHCTRLVEINLQGNVIDDGAARAIAIGLKECTSFRSLFLSRTHCEQFALTFQQQDRRNRKRMFGFDTIAFD